jgi:hypothetical protein
MAPELQRPYYFTDDSHRLLMQGEPMIYLQFGSKSVLRLLKRMQATGRAYGKQLREFPGVRCEPLEFFYQCRRGMDALDAHLFDDLMHRYSWREANWAVWLAALKPDPAWVEALRQMRQRDTHVAMTIDLALIAAGDSVPEPMPEYVSVLTEVRAMLHLLPSTPYRMRLSLAVEQQQRFDAEVDLVRARYRDGGYESAAPLLRQGLIGYYGMTRDAWLRSGAAAGP